MAHGDDVLHGFPTASEFSVLIEHSKLLQSVSNVRFRRSIAPHSSSSEPDIVFLPNWEKIAKNIFCEKAIVLEKNISKFQKHVTCYPCDRRIK